MTTRVNPTDGPRGDSPWSPVRRPSHGKIATTSALLDFGQLAGDDGLTAYATIRQPPHILRVSLAYRVHSSDIARERERERGDRLRAASSMIYAAEVKFDVGLLP